MNTYDTLTRAEIQEFQKAKALNDKIGKITPQTAASLSALLKKNPTTFKTAVGKKLAHAAEEIKETGSCSCIYCGANRAVDGNVLCEQHQNINFARMAEMKKQEEDLAAASQENSLPQNASGTDSVKQGQNKKKKLMKYALIAVVFLIILNVIGGRKSTSFKGDDLANYIGKSFEDLQKDYPYVQRGIIDITGIDHVGIMIDGDEIKSITIERGSGFPLAGVIIGETMESAKKTLEKRCKGKVDDRTPNVYIAEMKINGKACSVWVRGSSGAVKDVNVMYAN